MSKNLVEGKETGVVRRLLLSAVWKIVLPLLCCSAVWAQIAAIRLEGIVQDTADTAISGATLTAIHVKTGWRTQATSDAAGRAVIPVLVPGAYTLTTEAKGFRPVERANVVLDGPGSVVERFILERGGSTEIVKEDATKDQLPHLESAISGTFARRDLAILPQLDRSVVGLFAFQQGVQIQGGYPTYSYVNGTRQGSNNLTLDGVDVNDAVDPRLGLVTQANSANSVDQVTIITSGAKAEFGRSAGAQVLMATRSGGNRWSGDVFDYFRHKIMNANDFFNNSSNLENPKFNQNIFGISLAGPAIKDRTFVFGNFQGRRTAREFSENNTVLTTTAKSGLFTWTPLGSTTTSTFDIVKNDPRKLGIDPRMAALLKQIPDPNDTSLGDGLNTSGYRFNDPIDSHEDQFTGRVDHTLKSNHHLFFRYSWARSSSPDLANGAEALFPGQAQGTADIRSWGYAAGSEWTLNPRLANQFRFGYQRAKLNLERSGRIAGPMFIANTWAGPADPSFSRWRNSPVTEAADNLTWIKARHSFKAGFTYMRTSQQAQNEAGIYPNVTFARDNGNLPPASIGPSGNTISQSGRRQFEYLYNDLLGRMESVTQTFYGDLATYLPAGTARARTFLFHEYGVFVQDDWKIRRNLTLNLGVRYELSGVPTESNGILGALDNAAAIGATASIANFTLQRGAAWYKQDGNNFAPRAGFAWAPRNSSKIILRGGFGFFFDRLPGHTTNFVDNNTPASAQVITLFPNLAGTDRRLSDGIPLPAQPGTAVLKLPNSRSTTAAIFKPDLQTGYVRQFHLALQRELFFHTFVEAAYVGQRGINLFMNSNLNQLRVSGDFLQSFTELQKFRSNGTPVSSANTLVRVFGSVNAAVSAIGGSVLDQGLAGSAADTVDRNYFAKYTAAGVSDFYLRNYPQFNQLIFASNDGFSSYDSLQVHVRRNVGPLKVNFNYTWSKSLDNISTDCGECGLPLDSFNPKLNKAPSDFDRRRVINTWVTYDLPFGPSRRYASDSPGFFGRMLSNWTIGSLLVRETGPRFSISSGLQTARAGVNSLANYTGSRQIGALLRETNGVYWFTADQVKTFTLPVAGDIGSSGRNAFVGPDYFNVDISLAKNFRVRKANHMSIRGEMYNILNTAHFDRLDTNLISPNFSRFTATQGTPRAIQVALHYEF